MLRRGRRGTALLVAMMMATLVVPTSASAANDPSGMTADLEGRPLQLGDVSKYYCHDLDYPRIHCFRTEAGRDSTSSSVLASSGITYVIVWEFATYAGHSLIISQDYTALVTIGWNDKISSYKVQNSLSGRFWTDWFYGGTFYGFCCNQQVPYLGSFDNTFSSVYQL